jgi:hypothetical protein
VAELETDSLRAELAHKREPNLSPEAFLAESGAEPAQKREPNLTPEAFLAEQTSAQTSVPTLEQLQRTAANLAASRSKLDLRAKTLREAGTALKGERDDIQTRQILGLTNDPGYRPDEQLRSEFSAHLAALAKHQADVQAFRAAIAKHNFEAQKLRDDAEAFQKALNASWQNPAAALSPGLPIPGMPQPSLPQGLMNEAQLERARRLANNPRYIDPKTGEFHYEDDFGKGINAILDSPVIGAQMMLEGAGEMATPVAFANPTAPGALAVIRQTMSKPVFPSANDLLAEGAGGLHKIIGGAMEASTPLIAGAFATAPIATTVALGSISAAQKGLEAGLEKLGLRKEYASVAGDAGALLFGAYALPPAARAVIRGVINPILAARMDAKLQSAGKDSSQQPIPEAPPVEQNPPRERKMAPRASVPEEGPSDLAQRVADARDRLAQTLLQGDYASASPIEKITIDALIREGWGFSANPAKPEPVPAPSAPQPRPRRNAPKQPSAPRIPQPPTPEPQPKAEPEPPIPTQPKAEPEPPIPTQPKAEPELTPEKFLEEQASAASTAAGPPAPIPAPLETEQPAAPQPSAEAQEPAQTQAKPAPAAPELWQLTQAKYMEGGLREQRRQAALAEVEKAVNRIGQDKLVDTGIMNPGESVEDWLLRKRAQQSKWTERLKGQGRDLKTQKTGIQELSKPWDIFKDREGERLLRKAALEYIRRAGDWFEKGEGFDSPHIRTEAKHEELVRQALSEGKPVPPEVLAEYPNLRKEFEAKAQNGLRPNEELVYRSTQEPGGYLRLNDQGLLYTSPSREYAGNWGPHTEAIAATPGRVLDLRKFAGDEAIPAKRFIAALERQGVEVPERLANELAAIESANGPEVLLYFGNAGRLLREQILKAGYQSARINEYHAGSGASAESLILFDPAHARTISAPDTAQPKAEPAATATPETGAPEPPELGPPLPFKKGQRIQWERDGKTEQGVINRKTGNMYDVKLEGRKGSILVPATESSAWNVRLAGRPAPQPEAPASPRDYATVQADIDRAETGLEKQGIDPIKLTLAEMPERLRALYQERDAAQALEDKEIGSGVSERLSRLIPDGKEREALVKQITESGKLPAMRMAYAKESWRDIGRVADLMLRFAAKEDHAESDVYSHITAELSGTAENPGIRLKLEENPRGFDYPSNAAFTRAQELLDALMEGNAPSIPRPRTPAPPAPRPVAPAIEPAAAPDKTLFTADQLQRMRSMAEAGGPIYRGYLDRIKEAESALKNLTEAESAKSADPKSLSWAAYCRKQYERAFGELERTIPQSFRDAVKTAETPPAEAKPAAAAPAAVPDGALNEAQLAETYKIADEIGPLYNGIRDRAGAVSEALSDWKKAQPGSKRRAMAQQELEAASRELLSAVNPSVSERILGAGSGRAQGAAAPPRLFPFRNPQGGITVVAASTASKEGYLAFDKDPINNPDLHNLQPDKINERAGSGWQSVLGNAGYVPENVVGFATFYPEKGGKTMAPGMVYVAPQFRRQGVATSMYDLARKQFPEGYVLGSGAQRPEGVAFRSAYDKKRGLPEAPAQTSAREEAPAQTSAKEQAFAERFRANLAGARKRGHLEVDEDAVRQTLAQLAKEGEEATEAKVGNRAAIIHRASKTEGRGKAKRTITEFRARVTDQRMGPIERTADNLQEAAEWATDRLYSLGVKPSHWEAYYAEHPSRRLRDKGATLLPHGDSSWAAAEAAAHAIGRPDWASAIHDAAFRHGWEGAKPDVTLAEVARRHAEGLPRTEREILSGDKVPGTGDYETDLVQNDSPRKAPYLNWREQLPHWEEAADVVQKRLQRVRKAIAISKDLNGGVTPRIRQSEETFDRVESNIKRNLERVREAANTENAEKLAQLTPRVRAHAEAVSKYGEESAFARTPPHPAEVGPENDLSEYAKLAGVPENWQAVREKLGIPEQAPPERVPMPAGREKLTKAEIAAIDKVHLRDGDLPVFGDADVRKRLEKRGWADADGKLTELGKNAVWSYRQDKLEHAAGKPMTEYKPGTGRLEAVSEQAGGAALWNLVDGRVWHTDQHGAWEGEFPGNWPKRDLEATRKPDFSRVMPKTKGEPVQPIGFGAFDTPGPEKTAVYFDSGSALGSGYYDYTLKLHRGVTWTQEAGQYRPLQAWKDGRRVALVMPLRVDEVPSKLKGFLKNLASDESGSIKTDLATLGIPKFFHEDIAPSLRTIATGLKLAKRDLLRVFAPQIRGEGSALMGQSIRAHAAEMARAQDRAEAALRIAKKYFDRQPQADNYRFISAVEHGVPLSDPKLAEIAKQMRDILDTRREAIRQLGTGKLERFIENYFPHLWKNPNAAREAFENYRKRPFEGSKAFLKKRSIEFFDDGIALGLEPVSENPVDLVLLKAREMDKYLMAHRVLKERMTQGGLRYHPATEPMPPGFAEIDDRIGTVFGPPTVQVHEAYDPNVMTRLESLAQSLGIKLERAPSIHKGRAWGYATTSGEVHTKFGGPESVLAHEIGHQLQFKYNLFGRLQGKKGVADELRALADLRFEGQQVSDSYKRYVRNKDEKIANAIAALIYAPERFKAVAPNTWDILRDELWHLPELRPLFDIKPSMLLTERSAETPVGGLVIRGHIIGPEPEVNVLNNYLSPGLREQHAWFRGYLGAANLLNQAQLGLSAFHVGFTSAEAAISRFALGVYQMAKGRPLESALTMASTPLAPFTNIAKGHQMYKEWFEPGTQSADVARLVDAYVEAGGRARMEGFYRTQVTENMMRALRRGNYPGAALRLPFALIEQTARPIMEWIVPRQKMGVFADLARFELERLGPNATQREVRAALGRAQDSVDNRMGQMVYDNLFWNKVAKDMAMASVRSVGWNLGTIREIAGGAADAVKFIGRKGDFTPRMSYLVALPVVAGVMGSTLYYLWHGKAPETLADYYFPKDAEGQRWALPTYMKDLYHYATAPKQTLANKIHPALVLGWDMLSNRDYADRPIRNEDDPLVQQAMELAGFAAKGALPMSISNVQRNPNKGFKQTALPFIGVTPAPRSIDDPSDWHGTHVRYRRRVRERRP